MDSKPIFTIDLEDFNDALHIPSNGYSSLYVCEYLVKLLDKHKITAVIYKLENIEVKESRHIIKTHGKYHRWWENADRRPYQWLGLTGGFWFRLLPYWFVKRQILKHGLFYIHPHDLDLNHPKLSNWLLNWKRHVGLKTVRGKLERLLKEVTFGS